MSGLTEEQRRRIEENRKKALEKRNRVQIQSASSHQPPAVTVNHAIPQNNYPSAPAIPPNAQQQPKTALPSNRPDNPRVAPNPGGIGAKFMNSSVKQNFVKPAFTPPFGHARTSAASDSNTSRDKGGSEIRAARETLNGNVPQPNPATPTLPPSTYTNTPSISSASSIPASSSSRSSSTPSISTASTEEVKRFIEEKKKRALELRARKNSANVGLSSLASSASLSHMTSMTSAQNDSAKVPSASAGSDRTRSSGAAFPSTSGTRHSGPNDLWSRIPENGVPPKASDPAPPQRDNKTASHSSAAPTLAAKNSPLVKIKATCALISKNRFKVLSNYHAKSIELFKGFDGREYDVKTKTWSFSIRSK